MRKALLVCGALLALSPACDVLESATTITFCTDPQTFTIDSNQLGLTITDAQLPSVPCTSSPDTCDQAPFGCGGQGYSCALKCAGGTCSVEAVFEQHNDVNLAQNVRNQTQASALSKVTLSRIEYSVSKNSLTFDTPAVELLVGPASAADAQAAGVALFASMPAIPAGETPQKQEVQAQAGGQAALATFVENYQTPFRIFGRASLSFAGGDPLPAGHLNMTLKTCFKASPL